MVSCIRVLTEGSEDTLILRGRWVYTLEPNEPLLRLGIGQVRDRIDREGGQLTRARDCVTKVGPEAGLVLKMANVGGFYDL